jgi:hypothetical protein
VSVALDGLPNTVVVGFGVLEFVAALAAVVLLWRLERQGQA